MQVLLLTAFVDCIMYSSRGSNAYGQASYAGQSAYGQTVSLIIYLCVTNLYFNKAHKLNLGSFRINMHRH